MNGSPANLDFSLPPDRPRARFDRLYSELALHQAVLRVYTKSLFSWRKAVSVSHDGETLYDFARHGPANIARLHEALTDQAFAFDEGAERVHSFNGRERRIYLFPWDDRVVDRMLFSLLNRYFHTLFTGDVYAYRYEGAGVDPCQHRLARVIRGGGPPTYFVKRDIRDYFNSIDHEVLLAGLAQWVDPDDYLFVLLSQRIRYRFQREDVVVTAERGVPFGTAVACFLANFYLVPLDRRLRAVDDLHYFRYADDMLACSHDRQAAVAASEALATTLEALRLESKQSHHQDLVFDPEPDESRFERIHSFRHLGLEFRADGKIALSRDKFRKLRNLFRFAFRRNRRRLDEAQDPMARARMAIAIARDVILHDTRPVAIIDYYLKHVTDEEQLRRLDGWVAEEILAQAFRNGHRKGNFRKLSFGAMREWGLPSLRHRRRLLQHGHLQSSFFVLRNQRLIEAKRRRLPSRERGISSKAGSTGNTVT